MKKKITLEAKSMLYRQKKNLVLIIKNMKRLEITAVTLQNVEELS